MRAYPRLRIASYHRFHSGKHFAAKVSGDTRPSLIFYGISREIVKALYTEEISHGQRPFYELLPAFVKG